MAAVAVQCDGCRQQRGVGNVCQEEDAKSVASKDGASCVGVEV